jgi:hypothetical protein
MKKLLFDFWVSFAMVILFIPVLVIHLLASIIDFVVNWPKMVFESAYKIYGDDGDSPE